MQGLDWEFIVIERSDPNAMVLPGGKVVVHTGLLDIIRSDDELAAVLGHETAHVLARHVVITSCHRTALSQPPLHRLQHPWELR